MSLINIKGAAGEKKTKKLFRRVKSQKKLVELQILSFKKKLNKKSTCISLFKHTSRLPTSKTKASIFFQLQRRRRCGLAATLFMARNKHRPARLTMEPLINTQLIVEPLVETMKSRNAKAKSKLKEKQREREWGKKERAEPIIIHNKDVSPTLSLSHSLGE